MSLPHEKNVNFDRLFLVLLSKLDVEKISDSSLISNELLARDIDVVLDRLLVDFTHWSSEAKQDAKVHVMNYVTSIDRAEFATEAKLRLKPTPLARRIIYAILFCIIGMFTILLLPVTLISCLILKSQPLAEGERIVSYREWIRETSDSLSRWFWPDTLPPCYCCVLAETR